MKTKTLLVTAVSFLLPVIAFAQAEPYAVLEFYGDDTEIAVFDEDDFEVSFFLGMDLSPGDRIETGSTTAELRLEPNGTIMKIDENTVFTLGSVQGRGGASRTEVVLGRGRLRSVAARIRGSEYTVRTPGAVAGVRGTDFVVDVVEGAAETVSVLEGLVSFSRDDTGESLDLAAGQQADARGQTFEAVELSPGEIARLSEDLAFEALDPGEVPTDEEPEEGQEDDQEDQQGAESSDADPDTGEALADGEADSRFLSNLGEVLGLQIGSITLNSETYAQAVFQPAVEFGRLRLGLYLPVVYQENLFDPWEWYRPDGNNEWSFGSDKDWGDDPLEAASDLGRDVLLKVRYLEYGEQRDAFFFKVGNIPSITLGHGLLMYKYANDLDFPSVRRIGFNLGIDLGGWGFESVVNDLAAPGIYGGRLYFRPARPLSEAAVGLSLVTDVDPTGELPGADEEGNPLTFNQEVRQTDLLFLNVAMDVEVPILERDIFSIIIFGDVGGLIPYVRNEAAGVGTGIKFDALVDLDSSELKNFGLASGLLGRLGMVDYRLEYRRFDGTFRHGFYGPNYDRLRGTYAAETIGYLQNPDAEEFDVTTMGIYGEAGADLLDLIRFEAGYFWPWEVTSGGSWQPSDEDELNLTATIREGLLPLGISASFGYRRTFFVPTLLGEGEFSDATLFDQNSVASASLTYPVAPNLDLITSVYTTVSRDADGNIVYEEDGTPKIAPTVVIQTEIGF
ncbi:MAG: FecR family protein [Alkalispirochaetaceae bacterium]